MSSSQPQMEHILPLYLLSLSGGRLRGRTRLQKLVFLTQKAVGDKIDYDFRKAPYGPCSFELYDVMESLVRMGFVTEKTDATASGNKVIIYNLTNEGKKYLKYSLKAKMVSPKLKQSAKHVHKEFGDMPLVSLLDKVHKDYPHFVERIQ